MTAHGNETTTWRLWDLLNRGEICNGKIVAHWANRDDRGMMQQLGVLRAA